MKMFILGAVSFYVITSLIGFILDQLDILDILDFGEIYTSLLLLPFVCIYDIFKNLHDHWDYYKLIIKLGYFHKQYKELRNLDTPTLRDIQNTKCGYAVRSYIDTILEERRQISYDELKAMR